MPTPKAHCFCFKIRKFCFSHSLFSNKKQVAAVQQEHSKNIRCLSAKFLLLQILHLTTKSWLYNSLLLILLFCFDQVVTQIRKVILAFHCRGGGGGGGVKTVSQRENISCTMENVSYVLVRRVVKLALISQILMETCLNPLRPNPETEKRDLRKLV